MMEVQSILQAKQAQEAAALEEARKAVEKYRLLQAELQAKLHEMVAADAVAMQAFAKQRERMARESMAVAEQLKLLKSDSTSQPQSLRLLFSAPFLHIYNNFQCLHAKASSVQV